MPRKGGRVGRKGLDEPILGVLMYERRPDGEKQHDNGADRMDRHKPEQ